MNLSARGHHQQMAKGDVGEARVADGQLRQVLCDRIVHAVYVPSARAMPTRAEVNDLATEKEVTIVSLFAPLKYLSYRMVSFWMTMKAWVPQLPGMNPDHRFSEWI